MVCTTPITAATMPNAGKPSPSLATTCDGNFTFVMVGLDFIVHQVFDFKGIHAAPHHQPQIVGEEFNDVMVGHDRRIF